MWRFGRGFNRDRYKGYRRSGQAIGTDLGDSKRPEATVDEKGSVGEGFSRARAKGAAFSLVGMISEMPRGSLSLWDVHEGVQIHGSCVGVFRLVEVHGVHGWWKCMRDA